MCGSPLVIKERHFQLFGVKEGPSRTGIGTDQSRPPVLFRASNTTTDTPCVHMLVNMRSSRSKRCRFRKCASTTTKDTPFVDMLVNMRSKCRKSSRYIYCASTTTTGTPAPTSVNMGRKINFITDVVNVLPPQPQIPLCGHASSA